MKRLEVNQAQESLGIQIRPDSKMIDEVKYLRAKAVAWGEAIRTKMIRREEAWYCFQSTIMKTIEYPLVSTTISKAQFQYIMSPILKQALNKVGVQKCMPHKLVYGTLRTRGLNVHDPWQTQTIQRCLSILRHSNRNTPSRDLHDENMELVQTHVGSSVNFGNCHSNNTES